MLQVTITNTGGYFVDGICDAIGFFAFWLAITVGSLHRQQMYSSGGGKGNVLLSSTTYSLLQSQPPSSIFKRRLLKYYVLILGQMVVSAAFWNLFLVKYHDMLDPSLRVGTANCRTALQEEVFKSSLMFTIMWLWRCLNPHAMTIFFLVAVWLNMQTAYARRSSHYVFAIILGVSFLSEMHYQDVNQRFTAGA